MPKENNKNAFIGVLVLVFPLLVLAGMTGKAYVERNVGADIWRVEITGYDPRDLLYGHYLTFRYDWNIPEGENVVKTSYDDSCMCLNGSGNGRKDPVATPVSCVSKAEKQCESLVKVYRYGSNYSFDRKARTDRYYIPEDHARYLESLLRKGDHTFRLEFMVGENGKVAKRGLYIDDMSMEDHLRALPEEGK